MAGAAAGVAVGCLVAEEDVMLVEEALVLLTMASRTTALRTLTTKPKCLRNSRTPKRTQPGPGLTTPPLAEAALEDRGALRWPAR